MRLLGLALLLLSAGCWECGFGSHTFNEYVGTEIEQGTVTAPPAWGLASTFQERAGMGCPPDAPNAWECADSGQCQTACFGVRTSAATAPVWPRLFFSFVLKELPWTQPLQLPDARAAIHVYMTRDDLTPPPRPIEVVGGTLELTYRRSTFDARFALDAATPDDQHVTVTDGRFAIIGGHRQTQCKSDD